MTAPTGAAARRVTGVAEALPDGERVLWAGAPRRALVARHVLHVRLVALYFVLAAAWWAVEGAGAPWRQALPTVGVKLALGGVVVALLYAYAWATARCTEYLVTSRRVVLRVGVVFPVVINVPLALVASAGVRRFRDGSGQIALTLDQAARASWWLLWPNVRAGRMRWPEPLLRGLERPDEAAAALREAAAALTPDEVAAAVAAARADAGPAHAGPPRAAREAGRRAPAGTPPARTPPAGTPFAHV